MPNDKMTNLSQSTAYQQLRKYATELLKEMLTIKHGTSAAEEIDQLVRGSGYLIKKVYQLKIILK
jgi:hypothetical protein